jgi:hypothetical protein
MQSAFAAELRRTHDHGRRPPEPSVVVQSGLAEVVTLEEGRPSYRLASRFTIAAAQANSAGVSQRLDADQVFRFLGGSRA